MAAYRAPSQVQQVREPLVEPLVEPFVVSISTKKQYKVGDDIHCEVTITNRDNRDYKLLKHHTPLEGLKSHIFTVTNHEGEVPYDGVMVKRRHPHTLPEDCFRIIGTYEDFTCLVDLSDAHKFNSGDHKVQLKMSLRFHENNSTHTRFLDRTQEVDLEPISFTLNEDQVPKGPKERKGAKETKGDIARNRVQSRGPNNAGTFLIDPKLDDLRRDQTRKAYKLAYQAISESVSKTAPGSPLYMEWFGRPLVERTPYDNYMAMMTFMENKEFTLKVNTDPEMSGIFAYTHRGDTTIYLSDLYFSAEPTGTNCKMGIIVHEMSHAAADTDDVMVHGKAIYGQDRCRKLATNLPHLAIRNADNYEYFSEALLARES